MDMWETCIKELHEKWLPAHWRKDSHSLQDTSFIYSVFLRFAFGSEINIFGTL